MAADDQYPTCYDLPVARFTPEQEAAFKALRDQRLRAPRHAQTLPTLPTLEEAGPITRCEQVALKAIDVAEAVQEGVSKYTLAKGITKGIAYLARKVRDR